MSDLDPKSAPSKILYRVDKISSDLETLELGEHVTVLNMLNQMLQFRVSEFQKAEAEQARQIKEASDREKKFGLMPGDAKPQLS